MLGKLFILTKNKTMKNKFTFLNLILISLLGLSSCGGSDEDKTPNKNDTKDKEKESHEIVWMEKNLNVDTFRNGDPIKEIKSDEEWKKASVEGEPAWCYYENDPSNGEKYGKLYNWHAVNDPRGLAPDGYRIPTKDEWKAFIDELGKNSGDKMKSTSGWENRPNGDDTNGTDESGFTGLPGGYRNHSGNFGSIGYSGDWWSSTESASNAWHYNLSFQDHKMSRATNRKGFGFSVRCIEE